MKSLNDRVIELKRIPANDIVGAEWNWRTHSDEQRSHLATSVDELGFFDPLDVYPVGDGKYKLVDGHARRDLVSERIGPDTLIPCVVTDFSEDEARRANVIKDPLAEMAGVDAAALRELVNSIGESSEAMQALIDAVSAKTGLELAETIAAMSSSSEPLPLSDFPVRDESIPIEHVCPKCGYSFSGGAKLVRA